MLVVLQRLMVYKRYIQRGGKKFGPYYYESYRDKNGKIKTRYLKEGKSKKLSFFLIFLIVLITSIIATIFLSDIPSSSFCPVYDFLSVGNAICFQEDNECSPDGFPAGLMDKRAAWNTTYNPYKLYLKSWDYNVSVNEVSTEIHVDTETSNDNPYVLLDLQEDQEISFEINFTNSSGYSYVETKEITYSPLCEGDCYLSAALAGEELTNVNVRGENNVLFDRDELQRLIGYEGSDNMMADQLYDELLYKIGFIAGNGGSNEYKVLEDITYNGTVVSVRDSENWTVDFPISRKFNVSTYQYVQFLDGVNAGEYKVVSKNPNCTEIDTNLNGTSDTYRCEMKYVNTLLSLLIWRDTIYLDSPPVGTKIKLIRHPGSMQSILCFAGFGYKLKQEGWQEVPDDAGDAYYFIIREILLLDPMLGNWDSSSGHNAKCWGIGYDAIKERLIEEDINNGTDYNQQIRDKIAALMDYWVWKNSLGPLGADYNMAYIYPSEGIITQIFSDYSPPRGSNITGPREWGDRILYKYNDYINQYFSGQEGRSGAEYGETSMGDILTFALAYKRATGKDIVSGGSLGDYVQTRFKLQFGDRGQPLWGPAYQIITQSLSAFQNNYFFTDISGLNEMAEWATREAINQPNSRLDHLYSSGPNFLTYALLYDVSTEPVSPSVFMESDEKWRPTQFIPKANEVMFRDTWNYSSRNFFLMGKPDNVMMGDYYKTKFFYNGHVRYYEDGEHFFGSDPVDPRLNNSDPTRYQHAILTADGFYSASYLRVDEPTGTMKHEFSYYDNLDYFLQTAQVDIYYLVPGEDIETVENSLDEYSDKVPDDIPLPISATNVYPADVNHSRQVLYLEDYVLIFDDVKGSKEHLYEMTLPTYRVPEDVSVSGNYASVPGVENWKYYYKRDPDSTSYTYKDGDEASRIARIYTLGNTFTKGTYGPASQAMDVDNAYITQSETAQDANFLTVVSSDSNLLDGDELFVSELTIDNGKAASLALSPEDYVDYVIVHDSEIQSLETRNIDLNNIDFTGLLSIVRTEEGVLKDFYIKRGTSLGYGGVNYFSGDAYQLSLSYLNSTDIRGFADMDEAGTVQIYSPFDPGNVDFAAMDDYWPLNESQLQSLTYSYSNNIVTIAIPSGRGLLSLTKKVSSSEDGSLSSGGSSGGFVGVDTTTIDNSEIRVYEISEEQFDEGYSGELFVGDEISFPVEEELHYVDIDYLTSISVRIIINSEPQIATLLLGDERRFELTGDNYYDLYVKLIDINDGKVNIVIRKISEEINDQTTLEELEKEESANSVVKEKFVESITGLIYLFIILIAVLVVLILFLNKRKKRSIKRKIIEKRMYYS
jgi:hypothetical protein